MKKVVSVAFIVVVGGLSAACGSDTGRARVNFDVNVVSQQLSGERNEFGYTVDLSRAELNLSRLAFFEGEPLFTRTWHQKIGDLLVAQAYAHPGHYTPGEALADILVEQQFDLLSEASMRWGTGSGVTGNYASAELDLGNGVAAAVVLEGTASGPAGEIPFSATLDSAQEIIGLTAGFEVVQRPLEIEVLVDLNSLVERIDFGRVASEREIASAREPLPLVEGTQPYNAFSRAAVGNGTYRFEMKEIQ